MTFDDIIKDDDLGKIKNKFEADIATLEQRLVGESDEIRDWQVRVREIERHLSVMKEDRLQGKFNLTMTCGIVIVPHASDASKYNDTLVLRVYRRSNSLLQTVADTLDFSCIKAMVECVRC